jgi:type III secretion protein T
MSWTHAVAGSSSGRCTPCKDKAARNASEVDSPLIAAAPLGVQALGLSMARALGCAAFLPIFGKRHMAMLHRNALCMAISLPQAWIVWMQLDAQPMPVFHTVLLGAKEALVGGVLGLLLALPYWALQSACTLIDNQRGANAAQVANPSLAADASVLGELAERALIVMLIDAGLFTLAFDVLADSYTLWPALDSWPEWSRHARGDVTSAFARFFAAAVIYSGPVLLLLLAVELGLAISSTAVQGLDVYQTAMPVKSLLALLVLALWFVGLLSHVLPGFSDWWSDGALRALGKR